MRTDPAHRRAIAAYFDQTWFDYRLVWTDRRTLGMHFGYWGGGTRRHAESLVETNRQMALRAGLRPGDLVLDAGCGVGGTALWAAAEHGVRVAGITLVPRQAARGRRHARRRGHGRVVAFSVQDYMETAFPGATFDAVYGIESSNYAPDKRAFLAEAHRVLKPGGRLVVVDGFRTGRDLSPAEEERMRTWLAGWAIRGLARMDDFCAWAEEVGFTSVAGEDVTERFMPSFRRLDRITRALYPGAVLLRALRIRSAVQHGNVRAARDCLGTVEAGLWRYGIVSAVKGRPRGRG